MARNAITKMISVKLMGNSLMSNPFVSFDIVMRRTCLDPLSQHFFVSSAKSRLTANKFYTGFTEVSDVF